jgi:hypothetical protein
MRPTTLLTAALAALALLLCVDAALANGKLIKISGTHSRDEIKKSCNQNGGTYHDLDSGGSYCQSGTSNNAVVCDGNGKCEGIIYMTLNPKGPLDLDTIMTSLSPKLQATGPKAHWWWDDTGTPDHKDAPAAPAASPAPRPPRYLH